MTNEERLQAIRKREAAAAPGPWKHGVDTHSSHNIYEGIENSDITDPAAAMDPADAEFVAHARADIPWLVAKLEAACREIIDLQDKLEVVEGNREPGVFYIYRDDKTWQLGENGQWRRCER